MAVKLKSRVYRHLRRELLLGRLAPGQKLSDAELAAQMGISRTPVREALIQLEADGLIETVPLIGTFVKSLNRNDLRELLELREALETFAVAAAARQIDPATCVKLRSCCDQLMVLARQLKKSGTLEWTPEVREQVVAADLAFHVVLLSAAKNERLLNITKNTGILMNMYWYQAQTQPGVLSDLVRTWRHHRRIYRAVKRGQAEEARRQVEMHLRTARQEILAEEDSAPASALPVPLDDLL